jgi:hypothetical protein
MNPLFLERAQWRSGSQDGTGFSDGLEPTTILFSHLYLNCPETNWLRFLIGKTNGVLQDRQDSTRNFHPEEHLTGRRQSLGPETNSWSSRFSFHYQKIVEFRTDSDVALRQIFLRNWLRILLVGEGKIMKSERYVWVTQKLNRC